MMEERAKRKLTAILSADVKGYSRLMGEDEKTTVETLKTYREVMGDLIRQYRGRVVDSPGDNVLSEFASVVDAVECAVKIQEELKTRNEGLPEDRRMEFRIGIHHGDVIEDEERIYGDGVNVAARIEGLAEGGGICISRTSFDSVKNKLNLGYEYLGDHTVKNIAEPVRVYRVLVEPEAAGKVIGEIRPKTKQLRGVAIGAVAVLIIVVAALAIWNFYLRPDVEPASVEKMAYPLPDKPSIAVLPFDNLSGDPDQEYFSDGIAEEIITALSKTDELFVIARNSSFTYKGKPVKVQQVSEELGVRYVMEGSVRRSGDRVRITAQLIDAIKGQHLWAERYDRNLKDIFEVQDDITMDIVTALRIKLTEGEQARIWAKRTENLDLLLKRSKALALWNKGTKEDFIRYGQLAQEIVDMAPEASFGYRLLGWYYWGLAYGGRSPRENIPKAFKLAQKALAMDESDPLSHTLLGSVYLMMRQYEKAIAAGERAVALNPNGAFDHGILGTTLSYAERPDKAIDHLKQGIRLDPFPDWWYFLHLGRCNVLKGQYEEALTEFKKGLHRAPDAPSIHTYLAVIYTMLDRQKEARDAVGKVLEIDPKFCVERASKAFPYKNQADLKVVLDALRKAGLPETPPLPLPDKPSIAVLPFVNMSGDPEQEYFSDGISEEIITALSVTPKMFVIARTSSFKYKGKEVDVRTVGRELGVRYLLEGSVRKSEDQLRITAQLVDAQTGQHVWAERYDRDLKDIFAVQDEITMKITEGEQARLSAKGTDNLQAYLKRLQAKEYGEQLNKEDNALARKLAEEAILLDPEYAGAYVTLGSTHWLDVILDSSKSPRESLNRAFELTKKALTLDESNTDAHVSLTFIYMMERQHDKAIAEAERAVELAPGSAYVQFNMGRVLRFAGRPEEAIAWHKKAIRHDPMPSGIVLLGLCHAYWLAGRCEEGVPVCKKAILESPNNMGAHLYLAGTYVSLGRIEEARAEAAEVLRIDHKFSLAHWGKTLPFKNEADGEHLIGTLRKAGLK
jgi:adenylate cyclase